MLHVVNKPLLGPGGMIPPGQLVQPENWKNFRALVGLRYLRPTTAADEEGLDTVEINEHGISNINIFAKPVKQKTRIKKAKRA